MMIPSETKAHELSPDVDDPDSDGSAECDGPRPPDAPAADACCRNKCLLRFDDGFRSRLKSDLSTLGRAEKQVFLFAMMSINEEMKGRTKGVSKSTKYFQYAVREYGVSRSVCKVAFILLHDTTPGMVRSLCHKLSSGQLIPIDGRGKHERQPTISEHMIELIKSHFTDTLQSPTIFKCIKNSRGHPNINQLWLDFKEKYGYVSRSTYSKYIQTLITPDVLGNFINANEAKLVLKTLKKKYNKKN